MFQLWVDEDGDGCDARNEVLIAEAQPKSSGGAGCTLSEGAWRCRYDGVVTSKPTSFDIDHMVPLNEVWQSGAWAWSPASAISMSSTLATRRTGSASCWPPDLCCTCSPAATS